MSLTPTYEDLDALVKKFIAQHGPSLLTQRDYINAQSQDLRRFDQESGAKVFSAYDKMADLRGIES